MFFWSPKNLQKLRISQQSLRKFPPKQFSFRYAAGLQSSVALIINKTPQRFYSMILLKSTYFSDTPLSISLKISTIVLDPRLYESSENCLKLQETVLDVRELFETSENCLKIRKTAWDFRELFESFENCLRLPRIVSNFRELFETSESYVRFWEHFTTMEENTSTSTMEENSGLSGTWY